MATFKYTCVKLVFSSISPWPLGQPVDAVAEKTLRPAPPSLVPHQPTAAVTDNPESWRPHLHVSFLAGQLSQVLASRQ